MSRKRENMLDRTRQARILVVDDDPKVCELLTSVLTGAGFDVLTAEPPRCGPGTDGKNMIPNVVTLCW